MNKMAPWILSFFLEITVPIKHIGYKARILRIARMLRSFVNVTIINAVKLVTVYIVGL